MTDIFEYSNIFDPNIYSDICSYQNFDTNTFGNSFLSKMFIQLYSYIRSCHFLDTNIFRYSFVSKSIRMSYSAPTMQRSHTHYIYIYLYINCSWTEAILCFCLVLANGFGLYVSRHCQPWVPWETCVASFQLTATSCM